MMVASLTMPAVRSQGAPSPVPGRPNTGPTIRADFASALEARLQGWAERALESAAPAVREALGPFVEDGALRLRLLPDEDRGQLARLQTAAESIEALFVKRLLSEGGKHRFAEEGGAMGDFARDTMHQAMADQAARGPGGLGLARLVFLNTAETLVKGAVSRPTPPSGSGDPSLDTVAQPTTTRRTPLETQA